MTVTHRWRASSRLWPALATAYALAGLYYRYRPEPEGVNPAPRTYRVPADDVTFLHDTTWYERGQRRSVLQIMDALVGIVERARRFVLLDIFLFNLQHAADGDFLPTTRQIVDALAAKRHARFFITDPINSSYGTWTSEPITWLEEVGVQVCFTNLRRLRDNNLVYSPLWRLFLQWFGTDGPRLIDNPLRKDARTTPLAVLEALNAKANHRKVVVADDGESFVTLVTSSNFEDASCYFPNVGVQIRSRAVAAHFLKAERAVARMSGGDVPFSIPTAEDADEGSGVESGDAAVTPLMGRAIKQSLLEDIRQAHAGDRLYLLVLFFSDRDVVDATVEAARRGVRTTVVLDPNRVSFGEKKNGFPNQLVAAELARRAPVTVRWANSGDYEYHAKMVLLQGRGRCILHAGSANLDRRSLSGTNLEANVRVEADEGTSVCRDALAYLHDMCREPRSLPAGPDAPSPLKYWWYRIQEATGTATF